ncbi:MAG: cyclic nucleotide-binding domain-containing protein [Proteobacteria bacterium]|nr:cyclic nucleotide-binding domain-containing protein [Pseudomonadota bacterium]MCH8213805.1 cyclic nucleotide-binding domain-containing protein [Pseudomonadota bacterium]
MLFHGDDVRKEHYYKGATIFFEGDPGDAMFIVESGSVGIVKEVEGETIRLATLNGGELFGEMAIIDGGNRMASAVAQEDSVVLRVPREMLEAKLAECDPFLQALIKIFINNLRNVHQAYVKRPRSMLDHVNAISFHISGLWRALKIIEDAGVREDVRETLKSMDTMIKTLERVLKIHDDPRRDVIIGSEPSPS